MRHALRPHPDSPDGAATRVEAAAARPSAGRLALRYVVTGKIGGIRLPTAAAIARGDELWRHTCFEAFVRAPSRDAYFEFNFAPSRCWAAYEFSGYRAGMRAAAGIDAKAIDLQSSPGCFALQAELDIARLPALPGEAPWRMGLSAVIEDAAGRLSYWALAHPPGPPDFHHADSFALELFPAAQR